ncbi:MAG: hypothetical protein C0503_02405 [Gemmatimonas sp.]|nr:hypothetical protein [Gemmatimonas sp.]
MLASEERAQVGRFTLREMQRRSVAEIRRALQAHGGALLADAPGSGKTVLALAVAQSYDDVLVLVPAALRDQWMRAATRARLTLRVESHESLSRGNQPRSAALIVVDEAHHFRNRTSVRYRALAALARGRQLLLLSATPVVNRRADRDALLALFLGSIPASAALLEQVVLRRDSTPLAAVVRRLPPLRGAPEVPRVAARLSSLPPPFPTLDGSAAAALIRITLAMAWSSSLAALDAALRRRIQRGSAIADVLRTGRWPSRDRLRDWVLGQDAMQLSMPLVTVDHTAAPPPDAMVTLEAHLEAVRAMRASIAPMVAHDTTRRAAALRALLLRETPRRIVVLAQHAETVRALYAALRTEPGVVAITGNRVHAAAGHWTRDEVLRALGPSADAWRPDDPRGIRMLLATDLLAEGVELQGCATIIHADPAWTPARFEQREGRVAREGQRQEVHVGRFALPAGAEALLELRDRLLRKRRARRAALLASDAATALRQTLEPWLANAARLSDAAVACRNQPRLAAASSQHDGFIALLQDASDQRQQLLGGLWTAGKWTLGSGAELLLTLTASVEAPLQVSQREAQRVRRLLCTWQRRETARAALRGKSKLPAELVRAVHQRLDRWVSRASLAERGASVARVTAIRRGFTSLRGLGAERAIATALRADDLNDCMDQLELLVASAPTMDAGATDRISALLILRRSPDDPAPQAPSTGSAATR